MIISKLISQTIISEFDYNKILHKISLVNGCRLSLIQEGVML